MWKLMFLITSLNGDIVYKSEDLGQYSIKECIERVGSTQITSSDFLTVPKNSKIVFQCNKIKG
jgi:hypothetical protein